jgi:hypothetical protein
MALGTAKRSRRGNGGVSAPIINHHTFSIMKLIQKTSNKGRSQQQNRKWSQATCVDVAGDGSDFIDFVPERASGCLCNRTLWRTDMNCYEIFGTVVALELAVRSFLPQITH